MNVRIEANDRIVEQLGAVQGVVTEVIPDNDDFSYMLFPYSEERPPATVADASDALIEILYEDPEGIIDYRGGWLSELDKASRERIQPGSVLEERQYRIEKPTGGIITRRTVEILPDVLSEQEIADFPQTAGEALVPALQQHVRALHAQEDQHLQEKLAQMLKVRVDGSFELFKDTVRRDGYRQLTAPHRQLEHADTKNPTYVAASLVHCDFSDQKSERFGLTNPVDVLFLDGEETPLSGWKHGMLQVFVGSDEHPLPDELEHMRLLLQVGDQLLVSYRNEEHRDSSQGRFPLLYQEFYPVPANGDLSAINQLVKSQKACHVVLPLEHPGLATIMATFTL